MNAYGNTKLLIASMADAAGSHTSRIIELLRQGANPDIADSAGYTPLHYAVMKGNELAVNELLQKGAKRDAVSISGSTPLYLSELPEFHLQGIFNALRAQGNAGGKRRSSRTNKKTRKANKKRHTARRRR